MNNNILGRTGIEVSEISFGTVSLGVPYGIGIDSKEDMISEKDAVWLLRSALDEGINFFDTARGYGCSERRIGNAFKDRREEVVISTKCGHLYDNNKQMFSESKLMEVIENSLKESLLALQTDYIDVYMIHGASLEMLSNKIIAEVFSEYKRKGLARAIGVTTYSVAETKKAIESGIWDVIQLAYNLIDQRQGKLFSLAEQNGVGIVVRSVLLKGILTDRGRNLHPELKSVQKHREVYNELLGKDVPSLPDLATKFVLSQREVSSVLIGIDKPEYLQSALMAVAGNYPYKKILDRARELAYPDPDFLDLHKWDVKGWLR